MVITAPGLFSTTTFQPSASDSAVAMMRARMSGGVLADAGTTMRMTFDGKDCANADPRAAPTQPTAAAPARNSRLFMAFPILCWPPVRAVLNQVRVRASRLERKTTPTVHYRIILLCYHLITFRNERFHAVGRPHQAPPEIA